MTTPHPPRPNKFALRAHKGHILTSAAYGAVFGKRLYHKGVPKSEVREDEGAWYEAWSQTDSYRSM
jgi:hypothetical protein